MQTNTWASTDETPANTELELGYWQASQQMLAQSHKLAAQQAAVQSKLDKQSSIKYIAGPRLKFTSTALRYDFGTNLKLTDFKNTATDKLTDLANQLPAGAWPPAFLPVAQGLIKRLPDSYALRRKANNQSYILWGYWPLYTGGKATAAYELAGAAVQEQKVELIKVQQSSYTDLAKYYFGVGLAQQVLKLTENVRQTIASHDLYAQEMLKQGFIAKYERLQASVALADADRMLEEAKDNYQLAQLALSKFLLLDKAPLTKDKLFIVKADFPAKEYFVNLALNNNPVFAGLAAKRQQVIKLHKVDTAERRPQLTLFGGNEFKHKNWAVGVNLSWTLWDSTNRSAQDSSSLRLIDQINLTEKQAISDLSLLVEKNWLTVINARRQYFALEENLKLAQEMQILRTEGLKNGVNTIQDLMDAETDLMQVQTKRFKAAYDYVVALADLLANCGNAQDFFTYLTKADVRIN